VHSRALSAPFRLALGLELRFASRGCRPWLALAGIVFSRGVALPLRFLCGGALGAFKRLGERVRSGRRRRPASFSAALGGGAISAPAGCGFHADAASKGQDLTDWTWPLPTLFARHGPGSLRHLAAVFSTREVRRSGGFRNGKLVRIKWPGGRSPRVCVLASWLLWSEAAW